MHKCVVIFFSTVIIIISFSCSTTPTGRKQLKLLDESRMAQMGSASFRELKKSTKVSQNKNYNQYVQCISNKLLRTIGERPANWEVTVFEDKSLNAFALPGKKIGVHTGMIKLAKNQHQLATVIGHEIGHVLASHGNERVSQNLLTQGTLLAANIAIGANSQKDRLLLGALGLGAQFGVLLPFSRKHESEADELGLKYMAKAGFDPFEAPELWKLMSRGSKGSPPEFLSTHPSPETRIQKLTELAKKYRGNYASNQAPNCKLN